MANLGFGENVSYRIDLKKATTTYLIRPNEQMPTSLYAVTMLQE